MPLIRIPQDRRLPLLSATQKEIPDEYNSSTSLQASSFSIRFQGSPGPPDPILRFATLISSSFFYEFFTWDLKFCYQIILSVWVLQIACWSQLDHAANRLMFQMNRSIYFTFYSVVIYRYYSLVVLKSHFVSVDVAALELYDATITLDINGADYIWIFLGHRDDAWCYACFVFWIMFDLNEYAVLV